MDVLDFLGNMGIGMAVIAVLIVFLFLIMLMSALIPVLLYGLGELFFIVAVMVIVGAVIYFIGKFTKGVIRNW